MYVQAREKGYLSRIGLVDGIEVVLVRDQYYTGDGELVPAGLWVQYDPSVHTHATWLGGCDGYLKKRIGR